MGTGASKREKKAQTGGLGARSTLKEDPSQPGSGLTKGLAGSISKMQKELKFGEDENMNAMIHAYVACAE